MSKVNGTKNVGATYLGNTTQTNKKKSNKPDNKKISRNGDLADINHIDDLVLFLTDNFEESREELILNLKEQVSSGEYTVDSKKISKNIVIQSLAERFNVKP